MLTNKKNSQRYKNSIVKLTVYELKLIIESRANENYKNMSREDLLSTFDESECNFKNLSQIGLERIAKTQNLFQNELEQITEMLNLS